MMVYGEELKKALEVLRKGGVILYPTDTVWALGCDPTNPKAVDKLFQIKKLSENQNKAIPLIVDNVDKIYEFAFVPSMALELIRVATTPLTIVYPQAKPEEIDKRLFTSDGSIGVRVVMDEFCKDLVRAFDKPIVAATANIVGKPVPFNFDQIDEQIKANVDYIVKLQKNHKRTPKLSSIIKLGKHNEVFIIRK